MKRTIIQLPLEMWKYLHKIAAKRNISMASLVREIITEYRDK